MTNERIEQALSRLNDDRTIQNFIAQANARYILLNTAEERNNLPRYTIDDERLNMLALQYINLGCCLAENQRLSDAMLPLEKGAAILETIHAPKANQQSTSNYYGLIGAMSYYAGFQYSKSFILISKIGATTNISNLIHHFLLRDFRRLNEILYAIILDPQYGDEAVTGEHEEEGALRIFEIVIAKALDGFVKNLLTGDKVILELARGYLRNLKEIADIENDPGLWWVIRLLLIISDGFSDASVWNVLPSHFDVSDSQVKSYIRSLVYMQPRGIYELFLTQRKSVDKVLNEEVGGCVVSLPTSSGKTRIAEMAILHCIQQNPDCKILYIAPFRSLAFEIENSMERVFEHAEISVSHLYGGNTYSKLDELAIKEASLVIATPEKAKAILRGNEEFISQIKLVIIDEGHLLGLDKRLIVNEIFYEELRYYIEENKGRFLVLSAVLPNAEELAEWLTDSKENVYRGNWRPSDERIGILEWNTGQADAPDGTVNLKWESLDDERPSYNNRFIVQEELPKLARQRVRKYYPADFNQAVAATAYKLRTFGPVLIYVGIKKSVFTMAKAFLKSLGDHPADHTWKQLITWRSFELACTETYGETDNSWLDFARKGILCHNADLHGDVRLPLERLMRQDKPLVIISTSTLGQGVNLGVSTVIFSSLRQGADRLNERDFWNIAGRAGRAFVDHEGKIIVARNVTGMSRQERDNATNYVRTYFDKNKIGIAQSGIMLLIKELKSVAMSSAVDFELMLTLISENKISEIGGNTKNIEEALNWIDDTLLSLQLLHNPEGDVDISWTEDFFNRSLAAIQAAREFNIEGEQVTRFLESRVISITEKIGKNRSKWMSIVKSGIPLTSDLIIEDRLDQMLAVTNRYIALGRKINVMIDLLVEIEGLIDDLPVLLEDKNYFKGQNIDKIRKLWLTGVPNSDIFQLEGGLETVTKLYTFSLPWVLNGIAKKLKYKEYAEEATLLEELSILVETGLPSILKVKIYQAGIRSRAYANEIGNIFDEEEGDRSISSFRRQMMTNILYLKERVSPNAGEWLDLLSVNSARSHMKIKKVGPFIYGNVHEATKVLIAKSVGGRQFLISPDLKYFAEDNGAIDFSTVNDIPGIEFRYNTKEEEWQMFNSNPYVQVDE